MTLEKSHAHERSPDRYTREEKYKEILAEMAALKELERRVYDLISDADGLLIRMESNLPHWEGLQREISQHLQEAAYLLIQNPQSDKFYPLGAIDKLIDERVAEEHQSRKPRS
jgi:hypothetical protein